MNGFLNIDKAQGLTSRSVVDHVNRLLRGRGFTKETLPKVGHAGTLDPLATGVLVIAIGHASRLIELVQSRPKSYRGSFLFGQRSDTDDVAGRMVAGDTSRAAAITRAELDELLVGFRGSFEQVPPAFSAVRVEGHRAYKLARRGREVRIAPKRVEVHRLEVVRFEPPELTLDIECNSGTYIRSIGRDLGELLGCGAVMSALNRTQVGAFSQARAMSVSHFTTEHFDSEMIPCAAAASHLPAYVCDESETARLSHGLGIEPRESGWQSPGCGRPEMTALLDEAGTLVGIGGWDRELPQLRPRLNFIASYEVLRADDCSGESD